jgi:hypothetical protein|nr:MAG TPA: hypothetical protein [Caudoviricetes sp.]
MECEYKEFLLCDLCPKVRECKADCRVVSTSYAIDEFINKVSSIKDMYKKAFNPNSLDNDNKTVKDAIEQAFKEGAK